MRKGYKHSAETRKKIGLSNRISHIGIKYPNRKSPALTETHKFKISSALKGRTPKKIVAGWNKGKRAGDKGIRFGAQINTWKGGITPINHKIRTSLEYKFWRKAVFERDNYTCVWCNKRGIELNADHIKPFSLYPELRLAIDNGRTLCIPCHRTINNRPDKHYE